MTVTVKKFFITFNRLNKGYKECDNFERDDSDFCKINTSPLIDVIEEHENLSPSALNRLVQLNENNKKNIHRMNFKKLEINEEVPFNQQIEIKKIYTFIIVIFTIIAFTTIILTLLGNLISATIFTICGLLLFIKIFFYKDIFNINRKINEN